MNKARDLDKEGYVKKDGYWLGPKIKQMEPPVKPMFCPNCGVCTQHKDDRYLVVYKMCAKCYFDYEMEQLSSGSLDETLVGKFRG